MLKIPQEYKQIPNFEDFSNFKWYTLFVHSMKDVLSIKSLCNKLNIVHKIWAPCYQVISRRLTDIILVDHLLYQNYIFVGLQNPSDFNRLSEELADTKKGILLGNCKSFLSEKELLQIRENVISYNSIDPFLVSFNLKKGDYVTVTSGPCAGLSGIVKNIYKNGKVVLNVFFMNREITTVISVVDIKPFEEIK